MSRMLEEVLLEPSRSLKLSLTEWDQLIASARSAQLLARLAWLMRTHELGSALPEVISDFLLAHEALADAQHEAVHLEAHEVLRAVAKTGCPVVFLKGSAYVLSGQPVMHGRLLGDIDIMVPRKHIADVELMLKLGGWSNAHHSQYDQRYYRQWMHELPAMIHRTRGVVLDVHHTILPPTSRSQLNAGKLFSHARPLEGLSNAFVLSEADSLIHCATHLFHEGEFEKGLRDLHDFHLLLETAIETGLDESGLAERARELDLAWPLYLALRYNQRVFGTSVATRALELLRKNCAPSQARLRLLDSLYERALRAHHPRAQNTNSGFALWLLFVRSHWLRMPPHLLTYHLSRKAIMRMMGSSSEGHG